MVPPLPSVVPALVSISNSHNLKHLGANPRPDLIPSSAHLYYHDFSETINAVFFPSEATSIDVEVRHPATIDGLLLHFADGSCVAFDDVAFPSSATKTTTKTTGGAADGFTCTLTLSCVDSNRTPGLCLVFAVYLASLFELQRHFGLNLALVYQSVLLLGISAVAVQAHLKTRTRGTITVSIHQSTTAQPSRHRRSSSSTNPSPTAIVIPVTPNSPLDKEYTDNPVNETEAAFLKALTTRVLNDIPEHAPELRQCFLLHVLRARDNDLSGCLKVVKKYCKMRSEAGWAMGTPIDLAREGVSKEMVLSGVNWCFRGDRDRVGRAMLWWDVGQILPSRTVGTMSDFQMFTMALVETLVNASYYTQSNGICLCVDLGGFKFSQSFSFMGVKDTKRGLAMFTGAYPVKLRKIIIVRMPSIAAGAVNLCMSFLDKKIKDRITIAPLAGAPLTYEVAGETVVDANEDGFGAVRENCEAASITRLVLGKIKKDKMHKGGAWATGAGDWEREVRETMSYKERKEGDAYPPLDPATVDNIATALKYIQSHADNTVGLYRIAGTEALVTGLFSKMTTCGVVIRGVDFPGLTENDPHVACSAVKRVLMRHAPLIPYSMYKDTMICANADEVRDLFARHRGEEKWRVAEMKLLTLLVKHLGTIAGLKENNKMGVKQLATTVGQVLLRESEAAPTDLCKAGAEAKVKVGIVSLLVENRAELFGA